MQNNIFPTLGRWLKISEYFLNLITLFLPLIKVTIPAIPQLKSTITINKELMATKISISVVENCDYLIKFRVDAAIQEFENE